LFIYLFLRKVLAGVAKRFGKFTADCSTIGQMGPGAERRVKKQKDGG
jgi:hypothetical protein